MSLTNKQNAKTFLVFLVTAAVLWLIFGPIQLGGQAAYVIISGSSMEPDFKVGDLVIARKGSYYEIDQRVVYEHPKVGYVFHRIVDQKQNHFTLKGDNNDWLDSFQPTNTDIVGRYWFVIPGGGNLVRKLREPVYFVSFTLIILVIIAPIFLFQKDNTDDNRNRKRSLTMAKQKPLPEGDSRQEQLLLLGFLAAAALILGIVSFTRPLTKLISDDVIYQHQGVYSYSAPDYVGIYDSAIIETGDPVYLRLNCIVDMKFGYQFSAQRMTELEGKAIEGNYKIYARVSDADGWNRTFLLVPETDFSGTKVDTWMLLDICQIQHLIDEKEQKTETENRLYHLTIYPIISVSGIVNDIPIEDTYRPEIAFQIGSNMMSLPNGVESLALDQEGSLAHQREVLNFLLVFGRELDIETARWIAGIILGLSIIASVFPARSLYLAWIKSDVSRIDVQYHTILVDVKVGTLPSRGISKIEVATIQELAKLAERYGAMILHEAGDKFHRYSVQYEQSLFQYTLDSPSEEVD
jgi:signal peptidase